MRRIILLLIILSLLLCGCTPENLGILRGMQMAAEVKDEKEVVQELFSQVCEVCQDRDPEALQALFAESALRELSDFEGDARTLFDLFDGQAVSIDGFAGPMSEGSRHDGESRKTMKASMDVSTRNRQLRFALLVCTEDTGNPENVGLQSLYVIRAEDSDPETAYWGGWEWLPGVHIQGIDR